VQRRAGSRVPHLGLAVFYVSTNKLHQPRAIGPAAGHPHDLKRPGILKQAAHVSQWQPMDSPWPASDSDSQMLQAWKSGRDAFNWTVDLRHFGDAARYPGYFDRRIEPHAIPPFEQLFQSSLKPGASPHRAAEVTFWKNYGDHRSRDRITRNFFEWLLDHQGWIRFVSATEQIRDHPSWEAFRNLVACCGQVAGFATPLTYLAFSDPERYPMVDKRIGQWWKRRFPSEPQFSCREDGWIKPCVASWNAYLAWTCFCRRQAELLSRPHAPWRARDVEMAVWTDRAFQLP